MLLLKCFMINLNHMLPYGDVRLSSFYLCVIVLHKRGKSEGRKRTGQGSVPALFSLGFLSKSFEVFRFLGFFGVFSF